MITSTNAAVRRSEYDEDGHLADTIHQGVPGQEVKIHCRGPAAAGYGVLFGAVTDLGSMGGYRIPCSVITADTSSMGVASKA